MTAVVYAGSADTRTITSADWVAAGASGTDVTWSAANGWSLPKTGFTAAQLVVLAADGKFDLNAPDGPRGGASSLIKYDPYGKFERGEVIARSESAFGLRQTVTTTFTSAFGVGIVIPPMSEWLSLQGCVYVSMDVDVTTAAAGVTIAAYDGQFEGQHESYAVIRAPRCSVGQRLNDAQPFAMPLPPSTKWREYSLMASRSGGGSEGIFLNNGFWFAGTPTVTARFATTFLEAVRR